MGEELDQAQKYVLIKIIIIVKIFETLMKNTEKDT